ncbi:MAG: hypothetical protein J6C79_01150 [Clostridia bacterium]|nr:hypothetical protein [Clostridia bacterium]
MKKVLLLVTSLCFTGALAACGGGNKGNNDGGNGGGNISGETVANKAAWTQALTDSALATNATVSMTIKGEDRMGEFYEKGESSVTAKIANGKVYVYEKTDASWYFEEDGIVERDEEHDEDQTYLATIDGVTMEYFKELEQDWQISEWYQEDFSATLGFVLDWQADFSLTDVSEMYDQFVNNNGTYSCTLEMEEDTSTAQIKFVDGKVAWGKITMAGTYEDGATSTWEMSFTITYGNTTIGALPGQEEEPDSGNSSGGGSSASESGSDGKESDNVELPDTSVEIPETDGAPVANAEEWAAVFQNTLSATNATIITTASENGTLMEDGIVMIADGVTYKKWNNKDGSSSYCFYGEVNGQSYRWDSEDGKTWTYETTDWTPEDYANVAYELEGMDEMLLYADSKWDAATGMYVGENDYMTYSLKIADGKVVYISFYMESAMMPGVDVVYQIVYGQTAAMQLPSLDNDTPNTPEIPELPEIPDVDGEQVKDAAEWNAAWDKTYSADNFIMYSTYAESEYNYLESMYMMVADDKNYMIYTDSDGNAEYTFMGEVNGKSYEWISLDGKTWSVEDNYGTPDEYARGQYMFGGLRKLIDFETAEWDAKKGVYVATYTKEDPVRVEIKIADGYVVSVVEYSSGVEITYAVEYGTAVVGDLPALGEEEIVGEQVKDAAEWSKIIANTNSKTNYVADAYARIVESEITFVMDGYVVLDGNNCLQYMEMTTNQGGMGQGSSQYGYMSNQGNQIYIWRSSDGKNWSPAEVYDGAYLGKATEMADTDITALDFNKAKFDAEQGAYLFVSEDGIKVTIKVAGGLIVYIAEEGENLLQEFRYTYGNADAGEVPPMDGTMGEGGEGGDVIVPELDWDETLGDDISGEEVTEAEFANAIKKTYASTNFAVKGCANDDYGTGVGITYIAGGKVYNYTESLRITQDGSKEKEQFAMYMGMVDGVEYAWVSSNGGPWECGPAEDVGLAGLTNGMVFQTYLSYADYNKAVFDAKTGAYLVDVTADDETVTVSIKIVDGYVGAFSLIYADMIQTFVIEYGTAYVGELPPVSGGGSTGGGSNTDEPSNDEWDLAFENLLSGRNYSMKLMQDVAYYDGSKRIENISGCKLTEYAIEEESELRTSDEEGDHIEIVRSVVTNENGVDYEYTYNKETGIWEKAESSNTVEDIFQNMHSIFSVFAKMYDAMEWNANDGCFYAAEFSMGANALYNVQIVIENGNVQRISYDMRYDEYEGTMRIDLYDYECTEVTIPTEGQGDSGNGDNSGDVEIGGEVEIPVVGGETTIKALYAAIENTRKENNLQANVIYGAYMIENETPTLLESGEGLIAFCDNKQYTETTVFSADGTSQTRYTYCGNIDGKNYVWSSKDSANWYNYENGDTIDLDGAWMIDEMFSFVYETDTVVYDEAENAFCYTIGETMMVYVGIENGRISRIRTITSEQDGDSMIVAIEEYTFTYGDAYVGDLPEL